MVKSQSSLEQGENEALSKVNPFMFMTKRNAICLLRLSLSMYLTFYKRCLAIET